MKKGIGRCAAALLALLLCLSCIPAFCLAEDAQQDQRAEETAAGSKDKEKTAAEAEQQPGTIAAAEGSLKIDAKSAALIDVGSGQVLYEQNSHESLPPASVTKVMTMLLALEAVDRGQISMNDAVTISQRAASMGGSQMFMEAGETQTVETLLKGMAICSANDACVAIAEYVGGTEEIFVENMNKRAQELGMKDTNFVNTNGLPVADHRTSAYDIALMSRELIKHPQTKEWFNTWQTNITVGLPGKKQTELGLTNTNKLIKQYPGANGIKTGFTQEAGYCLSGSATKGDLTLIAVIMGAKTSKIRFAEAGRLLDYGFATYDSVNAAQKGQVMGAVGVDKGSPQTVNAVTSSDVSILVKKGEKDSVTTKVETKKLLTAPVKQGDEIGELIVMKDGKELERHPLVAESDVKKAGIAEMYIRMLKTLIE
ncbi:D-alanyl-D-alanine carboxypeptidase family protein [Bacilliculturomica massiliensis]|uniref:D-alanyl-D-alanine carboxypeptidase family protein n=1 Tax=Bacilliculturomica massiliensis TaxID=1917867 RepID=UPI00102F33E8|nr:D-alanyl-D-alanine carboxypeptidase family protein [Bacilliculturomica massiliensis]